MRIAVLAVATGLMVGLSLPPFDLEALGWFAIAPLLVAACGRRPLEAVGLGLLAGGAAGVLHVGVPSGSAGLQYAWLPFLWLAILVGITAAAAASGRRRWEGWRWCLLVATVGVSAEWLTTFSPMPLNLAVCQYRALALNQVAAATGIWGVSFLLWWCNAALADAWLRRRSATLAIGIAAGLVGLTLAGGRLALARAGSNRGPVLAVAAIQDHSPAETAAVLPAVAEVAQDADREEMTRRAVASGARLVVWSEACLGASFVPGSRINPTVDLARRLRTHLVVGYSETALPRPFNCASIVGPDGQVKGTHRKIHLFMSERQAVQPGREARAFPTPLGTVGMEICMDSCHTSVTRRLVASGAQVVAMPNFDPPTPRGVLHRLHAALVPFRAVENAVPIIRADSNGLSQVVDATGQIVGQSPLFAADILVREVRLGDGRGTLFTRLGDWFAYLCLLVLAGGALRWVLAIGVKVYVVERLPVAAPAAEQEETGDGYENDAAGDGGDPHSNQPVGG
jgi:apolipoprotein N-acyltransferase